MVIPYYFNETKSRAKFDREVINVFTAYMSRSVEKKDLIYVPYLLQKYLENFPDPYVE